MNTILTTRFLRFSYSRFIAFIALLLVFVFSWSSSQAASFIVTNTNDAGAGSLRNAITQANDNSEADTITFSAGLAGMTITLTTGEIEVGRIIHNDALTITGPTAGDQDSIIIDADDNSRVFDVIAANGLSGSLTLENLTLTGGSSSVNGGAVFSSKTNLTLNDVAISNSATTGNSAKGGGLYSKNGNVILTRTLVSANSTAGNGSDGGGIYVEFGELTLNHSQVTANSTTGSSSEGGGIACAALTLNQSTISNNFTTNFQSVGGGVSTSSADVFIYESTFSGNSTSGENSDGGGLATLNGNLTIEQSTYSGNSITGANSNGGAIFSDRGNVTLLNSTVSNNSSTTTEGGIALLSNTSNYNISLTNTILGGNSGITGNFGVIGSATITLNIDHSLFGDPAGEINGTSTGVVLSNSPSLGNLQDNGGPTQTRLPNATSPVINMASNVEAAVFDYDQRGMDFTRNLHGIVDIGAVELKQASTINAVVKRNEMAKALLQASTSSSYQPPAANGMVFSDVGADDFAAAWIEEFADRDFTDGCDTGKFCPNMVVTREDMAQAIGKVYTNTNSLPEHSNFSFDDVPEGSFNYDWITYLREKGGTVGCDTNRFCPKDAATKEWLDFMIDYFY